jgi:hypothetical protein
MAGYREFHYEKYYEAPDINILREGLNQAAQNIGQMFKSISDEQRRKKSAADQYNFTLKYGQFDTDNELFKGAALSETQLMKQAIREGRPLDERLRSQENWRLVHQQSENQAKVLKDATEYIDKNDGHDYYIGEYDRRKLQEAAYGQDGEHVDVLTRGPRLDKAVKEIGADPRAFDHQQHLADFVKTYQQKTIDQQNANPYVKSSTTISTPFLNMQTGKAEVSDEIAIRYMKDLGGKVNNWYDMEMNDKLDQEIKQMKAAGDSRVKWMDGLSNAEIKNELINNPAKNLVNQQDYGIRKREMARADLENAAALSKKTDYETKTDMSKTKGLYKNDKITYGEFSQPENIGSEVADPVAGAHGLTKNFAIGANLVIASGSTIKPITIPRSNSQNVFNVRTGESYETVGGGSLNISGYQMQAYDKEGKPYTIAVDSPKGMVDYINKMPDSAFKNLDPSMSIALKGYTINKGAVLGEMAKKKKTMEQELGAAQESGDVEKIANLEARLSNINYAVESMNTSGEEYSDEDMLSTLRSNGIATNQLQTDVLVKANNSDLSFINQVTNGLNLKDKGKRSREMNMVGDAWEARYKKAQANGFGDTPTEAFEKAIKQPKVKKAKFPLPKGSPKTVTQGGFTYTWNPETGKYE